MSNKDTIIEALTMQLKIEREGNLAPVERAKREWVGLTRLELDIATLGLEDLGDCYLAIEAKLKEKNSE
jgi:hypothetical protein